MTLAYDPSNLDSWWESRQKADTKHWVRISAEIGEWVQSIAKRDDLLVVIEPGSGKGAPAVFLPETGTVEINPDVCAEGMNPADIHMDTEAGRLAHPSFAGAGGHEGGHGAHSLWPIDQNPKKRAIVQAALLLEEAAMEGDVVREHPEVRTLLRATFNKIVNKQDEPIDTVMGAAGMVALAVGRADAGVLDHAEVKPITDVCKAVLGDRFDQLRQVVLDVQKIGVRDDAEVMEGFGKKWLDILGDDAKGDAGEGPVIYVCGEEHGEGGDGDEEGKDGEGKDGVVKQVADAVSEAAEQEAKGQVDAAKVRDEVESRKKDAAEDKKDEKAATEAFAKPPKFVGHGSGWGSEGLSGERAPKPAEFGQANVLTERIRKAQFRDRSVTTITTAVPPGRLKSAQAMKRSAERAMGLPPTAQPWKQTVRKQVDQPPITVGIGCDISGSMRWATDAVASAAWVIARAVHLCEGDSATVAYGERVHAVVKPGESPARVREFAANGGMENFIGANRALNGALQLEGATGTRLLVFISDGQYTHSQREQGDKYVARLIESGVKVLWIGFYGQPRDTAVKGCEYVRLTDPSKMGSIIGDAMVRLLEQA
jgi:hypothetical protein